MKMHMHDLHNLIIGGLASLASVLLLDGCTTGNYSNSPYHPGPVVGQGVGTAAGVAAGPGPPVPARAGAPRKNCWPETSSTAGDALARS